MKTAVLVAARSLRTSSSFEVGVEDPSNHERRGSLTRARDGAACLCRYEEPQP